MNCFTAFAVGNLAADPEQGTKDDRSYTKFRLIGNDYAGRDEEGRPREAITGIWFIAFGATGEAIARHCHVGDQLIVTARIRQNNWTDKHGEKRFDHSYQVEGFQFGRPGRVHRGQPSEAPLESSPTAPSQDFDDDVPF